MQIMFTSNQQQSEPTFAPQTEYLPLKVRMDTLQRLFANQALHADELMCEDQTSKKRLCELLLKVLANQH